jgi:glc operon protein GlcG
MNLSLARSPMAAACSEAEDRELRLAIAVVDAGGHLVALERMDGVEWVAADVALGKAYTAAAFQRPSADLSERSAAVPLLAHSMMTMTGGRFVPQKGGLPVVVDGVCVGAVGASGASGDDDVAVLEIALRAVGEHS